MEAMQLFVWNFQMVLFFLLTPVRVVQALIMVITGRRPTEDEATKAGQIIGLGVRCVIGRLIEEGSLVWAPSVKEHWVFQDEKRARAVVSHYFYSELDDVDSDILRRVTLELGMSAISAVMTNNWTACLEATHRKMLELED